MRGFYGQRCGTAVDMGPEFPEYTHPACHLHGEFHPSSGKSGRATTSAAGTTPATTAATWSTPASPPARCSGHGRFTHKKLKDISLKIPETGNGTPDILNEARWNLEWMLKMQDDDGGVWHKQTSEHFSGFVAPEDDKLPSEVIGTGTAPYKSTCATADLAAVGAIAARVYKPFDAAFAARALDAARKAWDWAEKNPDVTFSNPPGISTGEYGDSNCSDERLWAAAELWRTTGEKPYNDFFVQEYAKYLPDLDSPPAEGWNALGAMGLWTYALGKRKGLGPQGNRSDSRANSGGGASGGGAHQCESLPHQHEGAGLCLGLERRGGWVRDVPADRQHIRAG